ncbi:MAG TPA: HAD family hydrolase, partial [Thermoanaerobaculia bacterium]|nr:HAD family hydrolase [Thermoanaerobaculia bacterium]
WNVVLCTGAWSASARLKLSRAGFPNGLAIASCDEAESREAIVTNGIALMPRATHLVVFGDAIWDVRTARNLGLRFVGVGERSGAETWIRDYTDADAVLSLIS